jgi:LacI family transcriptional regulator
MSVVECAEGKRLSAGHAPRPRATIRDVAALAGVGIKTVSRVVNGVPTVAPELAVRVQRAAAQLNYRPNLTASNLRRRDGKTLTIGLLLEDIANPFSATLHRAIEDVARAGGVAVLAGSLDEDAARERELAVALIDRRVDGLIIVPAGKDHSYLLDEQRAGTGIVFVDRPPCLLAADAVLSNNREGGEIAVRHLIEQGHRRIAYMGDYTSISTAQERYDGYLNAMREAGLPVDLSLVKHHQHTVAAADEAATALLLSDAPPTALFASQNLVTLGAVLALRRLALQHQVGLVGFDDFILADVLEPGTTVVAQDPATMGTLATELLFRRLAGAEAPVETIIVPTRLIVRGSGEIPPPP